MNNTSLPAARLRPGMRGGYTGTTVMNDIHAVIASRVGAATAALECIAEIRTYNDDERAALIVELDGVVLGRSSTRLSTRTRRTRPRPASVNRGAAVRGHVREEAGYDCS